MYIDIKHVGDHYAVYQDGEFLFSADTLHEAIQELESEDEKC